MDYGPKPIERIKLRTTITFSFHGLSTMVYGPKPIERNNQRTTINVLLTMDYRPWSMVHNPLYNPLTNLPCLLVFED